MLCFAPFFLDFFFSNALIPLLGVVIVIDGCDGGLLIAILLCRTRYQVMSVAPLNFVVEASKLWSTVLT